MEGQEEEESGPDPLPYLGNQIEDSEKSPNESMEYQVTEPVLPLDGPESTQIDSNLSNIEWDSEMREPYTSIVEPALVRLQDEETLHETRFNDTDMDKKLVAGPSKKNSKHSRQRYKDGHYIRRMSRWMLVPDYEFKKKEQDPRNGASARDSKITSAADRHSEYLAGRQSHIQAGRNSEYLEGRHSERYSERYSKRYSKRSIHQLTRKSTSQLDVAKTMSFTDGPKELIKVASFRVIPRRVCCGGRFSTLGPRLKGVKIVVGKAKHDFKINLSPEAEEILSSCQKIMEEEREIKKKKKKEEEENEAGNKGEEDPANGKGKKKTMKQLGIRGLVYKFYHDFTRCIFNYLFPSALHRDGTKRKVSPKKKGKRKKSKTRERCGRESKQSDKCKKRKSTGKKKNK